MGAPQLEGKTSGLRDLTINKTTCFQFKQWIETGCLSIVDEQLKVWKGRFEGQRNL
jgi:hypothetical protein